MVLHANLHTVYEAATCPGLRAVLDGRENLVLFEGIALKVGRFLTALEWWPDTNGTDLVPVFLGLPRQRRLRVALVGSKPGVASRASRALARRFPNADFVATENGYSDLRPGAEVHTRVTLAAPDLVLFGLGSPSQELTASAWRIGSEARLLWCVGGLLDLWAGDQKRAPVGIAAVDSSGCGGWSRDRPRCGGAPSSKAHGWLGASSVGGLHEDGASCTALVDHSGCGDRG